MTFGFCVLFPVESTTGVPGPSGVQPDAPGTSGLGPSGRKSAAERGKGRQLDRYVRNIPLSVTLHSRHHLRRGKAAYCHP